MQLRFEDITRRMQTEWIYASKQLGNLDECAGIGDWMNAAAAIEAALRRLQSVLNASEQDPTEALTEYQFELLRWVRVLLSQLKHALEGINTRHLESESSQRNITTARLLRHDIAQAIYELNAAKDGCNGVQHDASQADYAANEFPASETGKAGADIEKQTQPTKVKKKRRTIDERLDEFVAKYGTCATGMSSRQWSKETGVNRESVLNSHQYKTCQRILKSQTFDRQRELKEKAKLISRPNS
jgi:hypothetical protein